MKTSTTMPFERFLKDVDQHQLTLVRDEGVYRHLSFQKPGTYTYSFQIVTWPGFLAYCGDMGEFMFTRLPDMFEFFRSSDRLGNPALHYWAQKCVAADKHDGIARWSADAFKESARERVADFCQQHELPTEEAARLLDEVESVVLEESGSSDLALTAAGNFTWRIDGESHQVFPDMWDACFDEYTARFVWCCYALQWGIATYDAQKLGAPAEAVTS